MAAWYGRHASIFALVSDLIDTTEMYLRTIYELKEGIVATAPRITKHLIKVGQLCPPTVHPDRAEQPGARAGRPAPGTRRIVNPATPGDVQAPDWPSGC